METLVILIFTLGLVLLFKKGKLGGFLHVLHECLDRKDKVMKVKKTYKIGNSYGLDNICAASIASISSRFKSSIVVSYKNLKADAKSMLDLMKLEAGRGFEVTVIASGMDALQAIEEVGRVLTREKAESKASEIYLNLENIASYLEEKYTALVLKVTDKSPWEARSMVKGWISEATSELGDEKDTKARIIQLYRLVYRKSLRDLPFKPVPIVKEPVFGI